MDKKQMERIARHYLGERLIRVEYTPDNKPPFQVVYNSDSEYHDVLYGNNVEEMCSRIATGLKSRGWVPTHERLEWGWGMPSGNRCLNLLVGGAVFIVAIVLEFEQVAHGNLRYYYVTIAAHNRPVVPVGTKFDNQQDAVEYIAEWCGKNLPYYLPPFPKNEQ